MEAAGTSSRAPGRPAIAFFDYLSKTVSSPEESHGNHWLTFVTRASGAQEIERIPQTWTMTKPNPPGDNNVAQRMVSKFDNGWTYVLGLAYSYTPGVDTNLRGLMVSGMTNSPNEIFFKPVADGIVDQEYKDQNDWLYLAENVCKGVVNPGFMDFNPIRCASNIAPATDESNLKAFANWTEGLY